MTALHQVLGFARSADPLHSFLDPGGAALVKLGYDRSTPPPPPALIPMPDPVALAQQQRLMIARQAAAGQGRAATILSPQPTNDKLGP
jgi:hypothetical protein